MRNSALVRDWPSHEDFTITCYEDAIPSFVSEALEQCYGSLFSLLEHFRIKGRLNRNTSTYVRRKHGKITALLLYNLDGKSITVLNELVEVHEEEIRHFTDYIFSQYKTVTTVSFPVIQTKLQELPYPFQQFWSSEDIVATLPESTQEYFRRLSKKRRDNIKYYRNLLIRKYSSFAIEVVPHDHIDDDLVNSLIEFNAARMAIKNKTSTAAPEEERLWITQLAKQVGFAVVMKLDGRICGGSICCRAGDNYYLLLIGHDPAYDDFSLGTLCCYHTIFTCIERGGKEFHFLWGRLDYKYAFLGRPRAYDRVDIYRTRIDFFLNSRAVIKTAVSGYIREAKFWLLDCERKTDPISKFAARVLNVYRKSKRTALRLISKPD